AAQREHRVIARRMLDGELGGVSRTFGEHEVTLDRTAREHSTSEFSEPVSASRSRVCDDDRALDQKCHVCDNERLKFCGVGANPTMLCPASPQNRSLVEGSTASCTDSRGSRRYSTFAPSEFNAFDPEKLFENWHSPVFKLKKKLEPNCFSAPMVVPYKYWPRFFCVKNPLLTSLFDAPSWICSMTSHAPRPSVCRWRSAV